MWNPLLMIVACCVSNPGTPFNHQANYLQALSLLVSHGQLTSLDNGVAMNPAASPLLHPCCNAVQR
jgi:hypothetical protein